MFTFNEIKEIYGNEENNEENKNMMTDKLESSIVRRSIKRLNNTNDFISYQKIINYELAILNSENNDIISCILMLISDNFRNCKSMYEREYMKNKVYNKYGSENIDEILENFKIDVVFVKINGKMIRIESILERNNKKFIIICKDDCKYTGIGVNGRNNINWIQNYKYSIKDIKDFRELLKLINHQ
jgi:hypothetical protein